MSSEHVILANSIKKVHQQLRRDVKQGILEIRVDENNLLLYFLRS